MAESQTGLHELWHMCPVPVLDLKQERYARLRGMMDSQGLDALVVLSTAALGNKGNLRYVTNYAPVSRYAGSIFLRHGDPVVFVPYAVHVQWAESMSWVEDVRFSPSFAPHMAAFLEDRGCATGRVGLVGDEIVQGLASSLTDALPQAEFVAAAGYLAQTRMVKGPLDIALARHAGKAADQVLGTTSSLIAQGATELEIFAAAEAQLRRLGCEDSLLLIDAVGRQVMPFPSQRAVAAGDLVQFSVEPVSPGGHWVQSVRMFARGEPGPLAQRVLPAFTEALEVAETTLRPGVTLSAVAGSIAQVLASVAPQGRIPYGHGIGMDNFETPVPSLDSAVVVESGMILVIHPSLSVEGRHFYLGDTYLVTPQGAQRLAEYPLDLIVV